MKSRFIANNRTPLTLGFQLPPFPENSNRYVEHDHDYYGLNQKFHLAASYCPTSRMKSENCGRVGLTYQGWKLSSIKLLVIHHDDG